MHEFGDLLWKSPWRGVPRIGGYNETVQGLWLQAGELPFQDLGIVDRDGYFADFLTLDPTVSSEGVHPFAEGLGAFRSSSRRGALKHILDPQLAGACR